MSESLAVAIDVGGTKVAAALIDERGRVVMRRRQPTDCSVGEALLAQVVRLAKELATPDTAGIGVAVPAVIDRRRGLVLWAPNLPGWRNVPVAEECTRSTGLPTHLGLDGHLAALGEYWLGAGRGVRSLVCLVIGTGVGGGLVLDGRLYQGTRDLAGCAGWMWAGRDQAPPRAGRVGTLESLVGGPALQSAAMELGLAQPGDSDAVTRLAAAATAGNEPARRVLLDAARRIGEAVADIVSLLDPELVVIGGGIGTRLPGLLSEIRGVVGERAQPVSGQSVRVACAELGDDAPLLGAARLVFDHPFGR